jgi:hypothetical protein
LREAGISPAGGRRLQSLVRRPFAIHNAERNSTASVPQV